MAVVLGSIQKYLANLICAVARSEAGPTAANEQAGRAHSEERKFSIDNQLVRICCILGVFKLSRLGGREERQAQTSHM